jgi:hypothetical protein
MGDFNGDNVVNVLDAAILAANWSPAGEATATPEPSTVALLLLSLLVALAIRRRQ